MVRLTQALVSTKNMFDAVIVGIIVLDLWGMIGIWTQTIGFHHKYVNLADLLSRGIELTILGGNSGYIKSGMELRYAPGIRTVRL